MIDKTGNVLTLCFRLRDFLNKTHLPHKTFHTRHIYTNTGVCGSYFVHVATETINTILSLGTDMSQTRNTHPKNSPPMNEKALKRNGTFCIL